MAAGQQRKHQRAAAAIFPQRHRPVWLPPRLFSLRRRRTQRTTPQNPRLENPSRGLRRTTVKPTHRCDDRLNPPSARVATCADRMQAVQTQELDEITTHEVPLTDQYAPEKTPDGCCETNGLRCP